VLQLLRMWTRRAIFAAAAICACGAEGTPERLRFPSTAATRSATLGLQPLHLGAARDGVVYVPTSYKPAEPLPLLVLLHGAGGDADDWFGSYAARAEAARFVLLAPDSRGPTWDAIRGRFGADVSFINQALEHVASEVSIDRARMALVGFSDGASYALTLGLANGDLFARVVAFSPGFYETTTNRGAPKFFVSHGTHDTILDIGHTRTMVGVLQSQGREVQFVEFDGGHQVPPEISTQALAWLAASWSNSP
jgi:phospholipase/carboxylesterase